MMRHVMLSYQLLSTARVRVCTRARVQVCRTIDAEDPGANQAAPLVTSNAQRMHDYRIRMGWRGGKGVGGGVWGARDGVDI